MLRTPKNIKQGDISEPGNREWDTCRVLADGAIEIFHFNAEHVIWGYGGCTLFAARHPILNNGELDCCGVCDTPEQFLERYTKLLEADERTFCVAFTHVQKDVSNKGKGGGWRWHKWGEYIGDGVIENEYLDDEDGFDGGVYCYHIYQTSEVKD